MKFSDESSFSFTEDKWARMEEIIMASEKKEKRRKFLWIFFSGFISSLLIVIPLAWYFMTNSSHSTISTKNELIEAQKIEKSSTAKSSDKIAINQKKSASHLPVSVSSEVETKSTDFQSNETSSLNVKKKNVSIKSRNPFYSINNESVKPTNLNNLISNKNIFKGVKNTETLNSNVGLIINSQNFEKEISSNKEIVSTNNVKEGINTSTDLNIMDESKEFTTLNIPVFSKTDSIPNINDELTSMDSIAKKDSILTESSILYKLNPEDENTDFSISFSAGAQYNLGYSQNDGKSISPFGCVNLQFKIKPTFYFNTGLAFSNVSNLSYEKKSILTSYDFGFRKDITTIQQKSLNYISIPLFFSKTIGRNSLGFGLNTSILVSNKSNVSTQSITSLSTSDITSFSSRDYGFGLRNIDFQGLINYSYKIKPNILLGASFNYGLIDVRQKSWTQNETFERNQSFRLVFTYMLK